MTKHTANFRYYQTKQLIGTTRNLEYPKPRASDNILYLDFFIIIARNVNIENITIGIERIADEKLYS